MKKIVYLFIALFIITGCEATYTIDIDDNYNEYYGEKANFKKVGE